MAYHTLVEKYKNAGFSPVQTLWLIEELRFTSSGLILNQEVKHTPEILEALKIRENLKKEIEKIQKPEDIKTYKKNWASCVIDKPEKDIKSKDRQAKGAFFMRLSPLASQIVGEVNREELINRISGIWVFEKTQMEQDLEDSEPDWDDVQAVVKNTTLGWNDKNVVKNPSNSFEQATERLQETLSKTGIGIVTWPFIHEQEIEVLDKIREGVKQSNQDLCKRFGFEKEMPLMGLNGKVGLALGFEDDHGGTCHSARGESKINLQAKGSLGVLAHEWFHAFDAWSGHLAGCENHISEHVEKEGVKLSEESQNQIKVWKQLVQNLSGLEINDKNAELWEELKETWVNRWSTSMPHLKEAILEEANRLESGEWDSEKSFIFWKKTFEESKRPNPEFGAHMLVIELDLIQNHSAFKNRTPASMFRDRFDERIETMEKNTNLNSAYGYFNEPTELLAHNFESGFEHSSPCVTSFAGQATLRYPLKSEALGQQLHWRRFFGAMRPILEKHISPKSSLKSEPLIWDGLGEKIAASRKIDPDSHSSPPLSP